MTVISNEVILAKIESTYGADSIPGAVDAVRAVGGSINFNPADGLLLSDRMFADGTLGQRQPIYGGRLPSIEFQVELKHGSAVDTPPEFGPLLRACGLAEAIAAGTSVTYSPASTNHSSVTIAYYNANGVLQKLTGCRGNVTFTGSPGQPVLATFSLRGFKTDPVDSSIPGGLVFDSRNPPPFVGSGSCTLDSFQPRVGELTFDLGNTIAVLPDANNPDGYAPIRITARAPKLSLEPELEDIATRDWITDNLQAAGVDIAGDFMAAGISPNRFVFHMDHGKVVNVGQGDREGIRTQSLEFLVAEDSGDDEFTLVFS